MQNSVYGTFALLTLVAGAGASAGNPGSKGWIQPPGKDWISRPSGWINNPVAMHAAGWIENPVPSRPSGWIQNPVMNRASDWIQKPVAQRAAGWIENPAVQGQAGWIENPVGSPADWVQNPGRYLNQPGIFVVVGQPLAGRNTILITSGFADLVTALQHVGEAAVTVS